FLPRFALSESDVLRVLICEGPMLLAWVGVFRAGKFSAADARRFNELVPPLQRRLAFEQKLADAERLGVDLASALERMAAPAFVLRKRNTVVHANAAGRALLDDDLTWVLDRQPAQSARLSADLQLVLLDPPPGDPAALAAQAAVRWSLTPRQAEVLRLVGQGHSNRALSAELGCAESTIELHVSALLHKAHCESRAQLVARLWSGS